MGKGLSERLHFLGNKKLGESDNAIAQSSRLSNATAEQAEWPQIVEWAYSLFCLECRQDAFAAFRSTATLQPEDLQCLAIEIDDLRGIFGKQ